MQDYYYAPEFVYASSMHWIVLFICIILGIVIIYQLFHIGLSKQKNKHSKLRYLLLAILFLLYNAFNGLLPDENFPTSELIQYVITYSISIITCIYLVWYLYKEFDIKTPSTIFKIKSLIIILSLCFVFLFVLPYYISGSLDYARSIFLVFPSILSILFIIYFFRLITKKTNRQRYFKIQTYLGMYAIFAIILLPILTFFGDFQPITQSIVSSAFFSASVMEVHSHLYKLKNTYRLSSNIVEKYSLTNRENEIALQIIKGRSYKEIAKNMYIAYGTVRKHASNIFVKTGASNVEEFIAKFKK